MAADVAQTTGWPAARNRVVPVTVSRPGPTGRRRADRVETVTMASGIPSALTSIGSGRIDTSRNETPSTLIVPGTRATQGHGTGRTPAWLRTTNSMVFGVAEASVAEP